MEQEGGETSDGAEAPDWERALRDQVASRSHRVIAFSARNFPGLAEALGISANVSDGGARPDELARRVRQSVQALDRDLAGDWRYDEFRARVWGGCAWWGITDLMPTQQHWAQHVSIARLKALRGGVVDVDQRSFRHSWAGYQYRVRREKGRGQANLLSKDYEQGRRQLGRSFHDALIAFLHALVENGEGTEYWDPTANRFERGGMHAALQVQESSRDVTSEAAPEDDGERRYNLTVWRNIDLDPLGSDALRLLGNAQIIAHSLCFNDLEPTFRAVSAVFRQAGIPDAATFKQLGDRLHLLGTVREILDRFSPEAFDATLENLVAAYREPATRFGEGSLSRRRLRRQATELLRPGVVAARGMGDELSDVLAVRNEWRQVVEDENPPTVPAGYDDALRLFATAAERLNWLAAFVGPHDLRLLPIGELRLKLKALSSDAGKEEAEELVKIRESMRSYGLRRILMERVTELQVEQPDRHPRLIELELASAIRDTLAANPEEELHLLRAARPGQADLDFETLATLAPAVSAAMRMPRPGNGDA